MSRPFPHGIHCASVRVLCCLLSVAVAGTARGQVVDEPPVLIGVLVDGEGLMGVRKITADPKLLAARKAALAKAAAKARVPGNKAQLGYISLPRAFAEVKQCVDAGKPVPDDLRFLGGMTKLRYVFAFPEEKDLVIAGDVEPYDQIDPRRPIGLKTGRPVLQLDDLVTLLRTVGPGNGKNAFGCSIDPAADAMKRVEDIIKDKDNKKLPKDQKTQMMIESVGPHTVRYIGQETDTRVAYVCVEADYLLKRLAMGIDKSPVAAVQHKHQNERLQFNGMWFTPSFEPLLVSADGNAFEIKGQSLQLNARGDQFIGNAPPTPATAGYVKNFTKYFPQLAAAIPAFADLWNITDLALVAALIGEDRLHQKAGWDIRWVMDPKGYPVEKLPVARTADTLGLYTGSVYIIGGIELSLNKYVKERQRDEEGKVKEHRARPSEGWRLFTEE